MDYSVIFCLVLAVGLAAAMTADVILDMETIWNNAGQSQDEVVETPEPAIKAVADISWVNVIEDSELLPEVDVIALAKSRIKVKPVIQAGVKVRELLNGLGKSVQQLVDYSTMTVVQLKAIAKQRAIPKYGSMRKAELIAALQSQ